MLTTDDSTFQHYQTFDKKVAEYERLLISRFQVIEKAESLRSMGSGIIGKFKQNQEGTRIITETTNEVLSISKV